MKWRLVTALTVLLNLHPAWSQQTSSAAEEARRHMIRGRAALEAAQSLSAFREARTEFSKAVELAPNWADAHYNLGVVQTRLNDLNGAIASYHRYLELAPDAQDAQQVKDEIVKLEYQKEQLERTSPFIRHQAMLTEGGIGAGIKADAGSGEIRISMVARGSPAEEAGLQVGDRLLSADGKPLTGLREDQVIGLIRGAAGTPVQLSVLREGWAQPREFTITRLKVQTTRFVR